jgi:hypothetical protein
MARKKNKKQPQTLTRKKKNTQPQTSRVPPGKKRAFIVNQAIGLLQNVMAGQTKTTYELWHLYKTILQRLIDRSPSEEEKSKAIAHYSYKASEYRKVWKGRTRIYTRVSRLGARPDCTARSTGNLTPRQTVDTV